MKIRLMLSALTIVFSVYLVIRGFFIPESVDQPVALFACAALTVLITIVALAAPAEVDDRADRYRPIALAPTIIVFVVVIALPWMVSFSVAPIERIAPHATWYVGSAGLVLTVLMLRRRPVFAWLGTVIVVISTVVLMGALPAFTLGTLGSMLWVLTAHIVVHFVDRLYADTVVLTDLQRAAAAWRSVQAARTKERRERVQYALQVAGPILTTVIDRDGELNDLEREQASIAEGTLRDEMRGSILLDAEVRSAIKDQRLVGASITLLDEGGLGDLDARALGTVRAELADAIRRAHAPRLFIRSSPHPDVVVTVVGRSASDQGLSDEDSVTLWREIARPDPTAATPLPIDSAALDETESGRR